MSAQPSQAESIDTQPTKYFEIELNQAQFKALQKLLPKGFTLEVLTKARKEAPPKPTKKIFTNVLTYLRIIFQPLGRKRH